MSIKMVSAAMEVAEEDATLSFAMQLASLHVLPSALKVAVELHLFELMEKKGPDAFVSPAELAAELPASNAEAHDMLDRILRLLTSQSIVNCRVKMLPDGSVERSYSLTPVSKFYTTSEDGVSLAPLLILNLDRILMETRNHLKDSILEGGYAFKRAHKMSVFEYMVTDGRFGKVFDTAMSNNSTIVMKKVVEKYEGFKGIETLVDVGGGIGASLHIILSKHPTIKAINFDLPHVIRNAPSHPGVENVGGDMFVSVPKADAIFMKWILHDWSDTHCLQILKRCHEALPNNGKVIVVENILPEVPSEGLICSFQLDVAMLAFNLGGKERTEREFGALAKQAGFKKSNVVCCVLPFWVLELHK